MTNNISRSEPIAPDGEREEPRTVARLLAAARLVLGTLFLIFGANGFLQFMPVPPAEPAAERLIFALIQSGYFFPMVKGVEVVSGALLLSGQWVPLALLLLTPVLVGITSIHVFLNPAGLPLMAGIWVLHLAAVAGSWATFSPLLSRRRAIHQRPTQELSVA